MALDLAALLLGLAFLPSLFYLGVLAARHPGRSGRRALSGFLYGATLSFVVLLGLWLALAAVFGNPVRAFQGFFPERDVNEEVQRDLVLIVLLAPVLEEAAKGFGAWLLGRNVRAPRDGALLGGAIGLGFAAVETYGYLLVALGDAGSEVAGATLLTVVVIAGARSLTAALMHPAAAGLTGYGIARARLAGRSALAGAAPFYLAAVALHGTYNYLAGFLPPQDIGGLVLEVNLPAALLLAALAWGLLKRGVAGRA